MQLDKNQVQQIKYDIEKSGRQTTNQEIRKVAESFDVFDREGIAAKVTATQDFNLTVIPKSQLTLSEKQSLVKIEAAQMGVEVSDAEILEFVDSQQQEFTDSIQYLASVRELIKDFLIQRNQ